MAQVAPIIRQKPAAAANVQYARGPRTKPASKLAGNPPIVQARLSTQQRDGIILGAVPALAERFVYRVVHARQLGVVRAHSASFNEEPGREGCTFQYRNW